MSAGAANGRVVIVYESMFGSTRRIAEAIAEGMRGGPDVTVLPVKDAPETFPDADAIVVGAPTHVHGLSRPSTRAEAGRWGDDPDRALTLEPDAEGIGMREWLDSCGTLPGLFAAFDTRADMTELFSGSAAAALDKRLRAAGSRRFADRASFLVDKDSALEAGELERARAWGGTLAQAVGSRAGAR
ncbi:flavodoxin domain-containing protein [Leifsonia sp. WHRI 6310E]|uniref:flavodoxin family protein n=1 Tax=Leifsonia sp. WHRI 6310E TaxID=3162562 RepID=UPI0032EDF865